MAKRLYLLFAILTTASLARAQKTQYHGLVRDTAGLALEFVNVAALQLPDSTLIGGTITNQEGKFNLSLPGQNDHLVFRISALGYSTQLLPPNAVEAVTLYESSTELAAVRVSGKQKTFQVKGNNLVCNISGTSLGAESNTNDILGKLPGFYMQGDELRSLQEGSILFFINKRPATREEIAQLDPSTIKAIEIDRHPGSRFSGEVGTVVYVHTHSRLEGLYGFIRSYTRVNHWYSQSVDGEIGYRFKRVALTLGADYSMLQSKTNQKNTFELVNSNHEWKVTSWDEKEENRNTSQTYFLALEYSPSERHQLDARYTFEPSRQKALLVGGLSVRNSGKAIDDGFKNDVFGKFSNHSVNLHYNGQLSESFALDIASDWYQGQGDYTFNLVGNRHSAESVTKSNSSLYGVSPRVNYQAGQIHAELGGDWTLSSVKGTTTLNIDDVEPTDNMIQEQKGAGYFNAGWTSTGQAWTLNLGVRYEATSKVYFDYTASNTPRRFFYHTVLPSSSITYTRGSWSHQIDYRASIQYPSFSQLSGGDSYINQYNLMRSNPELVHTIMHDVSYSVSFRWLYLSAGYNYTYQPILETFELESTKEDYRVIARPQNLDYMQGVQAFANAAPRFGFYEPRFMLGYMQNFMKLPEMPGGTPRTISKPTAIVSIDNGFNLPQDWSLSLNYTFNSGGSAGFVEYSRTHSLDVSVQKYFLNRSLQVSLKGVDLLNMATPRISGNCQGVTIDSFSWMDMRSVRLTIMWRFNKYHSKEARSSLSSEKDRL